MLIVLVKKKHYNCKDTYVKVSNIFFFSLFRYDKIIEKSLGCAIYL